MKRLPNTPLVQAILDIGERDRYINDMDKAPIGIRMTQLMNYRGEADFNILLYQTPTESPWRLPSNLVYCELIATNKKYISLHYLKLMWMEHVNQFYGDSVQVYTDGSKSDVGTGGAYVIYNGESNFKLDSRASIFSAELYAILKVLNIIV